MAISNTIVDITDRVRAYRSLIIHMWQCLVAVDSGLHGENLLEAGETFGAACGPLFSMMVMGEASIHASTLRSPLQGGYPFDAPITNLFVTTLVPIKEVFLFERETRRYSVSILAPGKFYPFIDLDDCLDSEGGPLFEHMRVLDQDQRELLVPIESEARVVLKRSTQPG